MMWTPDLSVGVTIIDEQHKTLIEKADKLFEAGKNRQAKEYINEMLDFLKSYTIKHFHDEEQYMLSIKYPGFDEQKKAHSGFIAQLEKITTDFNKSGGNILVILNTNQLVSNWLITHISKLDKKIGEYVNVKIK
ncbi:MAG: hemerythrin-like metal-binding protein [Clostridia bacterium]|nr:hemerythrin-like metal-binding protein [Clostridia bacterium]